MVSLRSTTTHFTRSSKSSPYIVESSRRKKNLKSTTNKSISNSKPQSTKSTNIENYKNENSVSESKPRGRPRKLIAESQISSSKQQKKIITRNKSADMIEMNSSDDENEDRTKMFINRSSQSTKKDSKLPRKSERKGSVNENRRLEEDEDTIATRTRNNFKFESPKKLVKSNTGHKKSLSSSSINQESRHVGDDDLDYDTDYSEHLVPTASPQLKKNGNRYSEETEDESDGTETIVKRKTRNTRATSKLQPKLSELENSKDNLLRPVLKENTSSNKPLKRKTPYHDEDDDTHEHSTISKSGKENTTQSLSPPLSPPISIKNLDINDGEKKKKRKLDDENEKEDISEENTESISKRLRRANRGNDKIDADIIKNKKLTENGVQEKTLASTRSRRNTSVKNYKTLNSISSLDIDTTIQKENINESTNGADNERTEPSVKIESINVKKTLKTSSNNKKTDKMKKDNSDKSHLISTNNLESEKITPVKNHMQQPYIQQHNQHFPQHSHQHRICQNHINSMNYPPLYDAAVRGLVLHVDESTSAKPFITKKYPFFDPLTGEVYSPFNPPQIPNNLNINQNYRRVKRIPNWALGEGNSNNASNSPLSSISPTPFSTRQLTNNVNSSSSLANQQLQLLRKHQTQLALRQLQQPQQLAQQRNLHLLVNNQTSNKQNASTPTSESTLSSSNDILSANSNFGLNIPMLHISGTGYIPSPTSSISSPSSGFSQTSTAICPEIVFAGPQIDPNLHDVLERNGLIKPKATQILKPEDLLNFNE